MKATHKKKVLSIGIILSLSFFVVACKQKQIEPNVVLIVVDTLGAVHLPFHGYGKNTAPFLTELSSQNVIFENAFSASSWTAPSTASLLTSLYPFQHGVVMGMAATMRNKIELNRIPEKVKTLTEVLKETGYATYGVAENININEKIGFTQGFDKFKRFTYTKFKMQDQLVEWSDEIKSQKKYFLYIHYNDPHQPYHRRSPWYEKKENPKADLMARYDSEINYVDDKIREMYELFDWKKNTLLVITADHGEEFWEHDSQGHGGTLYSEVIHVPMIMQFPGEDRIQRRITANVTNLDILPTIRNYLGIESSETEEGVDLKTLIQGKGGYDRHRYLFSHLDRIRKQKGDLKFISTISGEWKLIYQTGGEGRELYNLKEDPGEKRNAYVEVAGTADLLLSEFLKFEKNCKKFSKKKVEILLDKEKIEELKALGYVK